MLLNNNNVLDTNGEGVGGGISTVGTFWKFGY